MILDQGRQWLPERVLVTDQGLLCERKMCLGVARAGQWSAKPCTETPLLPITHNNSHPLKRFESLPGGDLYSAIRRHPDLLRWDRLGKKVAKDVALGLHYLHTRRVPVLHRDLKSPNILLTGAWAPNAPETKLCGVQRGEGLSTGKPSCLE